jgi:hypothetical protein
MSIMIATLVAKALVREERLQLHRMTLRNVLPPAKTALEHHIGAFADNHGGARHHAPLNCVVKRLFDPSPVHFLTAC